nr:prefoldin subunit 6 [Ipomoea batatas]
MASALRDLQRDLESKANDLSQLQKGNLLHPFLPELDLLNEEANVYKLIGPVLVKQDLAEARANVKKRIDYISAELKRLDATLQDLEEKQNSKKETFLRSRDLGGGPSIDFSCMEQSTFS